MPIFPNNQDVRPHKLSMASSRMGSLGGAGLLWAAGMEMKQLLSSQCPSPESLPQCLGDTRHCQQLVSSLELFDLAFTWVFFSLKYGSIPEIKCCFIPQLWNSVTAHCPRPGSTHPTNHCRIWGTCGSSSQDPFITYFTQSTHKETKIFSSWIVRNSHS